MFHVSHRSSRQLPELSLADDKRTFETSSRSRGSAHDELDVLLEPQSPC